MKKAFCTTSIMMVSILATAQNLVPNPGFEEYNACPTSFGQIECPLFTPPYPPTVKNWFSALPNSPDYYNACSPDRYATVPNNFYGHKPANTGDAYTGIVLYSATSVQPLGYIEYLEVKLDSALRPGQKYLVSAYVKPAFYRDSSSSTYHMAVQYVPAAFSKTQVVQHSSPLLLLHQVNMYNSTKSYIDDTIKWTRVSGYYTATGGEQWFVLGVFYNKYPSVTPIFPPGGVPTQSMYAYYMIDDVSVTTAIPCDTIVYEHDTLNCTYPPGSMQLNSSLPGANSYAWQNATTTQSISVNTGGKYWCTATNDECNYTVDTFNVSFYKDTTITSIETVTCDTVHTFRGAESADTYRWNTGDTTPSITVNMYGIYSCTAVVNCSLKIAEYDVSPKEIYGMDSITKSADVSVCIDSPILIGTAYDFAKSYLWNTGDTACCITPEHSGRYILSVNSECFTYKDTIEVEKHKCSNCIFIPDAFTPNKDGLNDLFGVKVSCPVANFSLQIYNRWGQQVFATTNIDARWNGLFNADIAPIGTYYYYLKYNTLSKPDIITQKGSVHLLR